MNNIIEGFESRTVKQFIEYLGVYKASCEETSSILYGAMDCEYIAKKEFDDLYDHYIQENKQVYGISRKL